MFPGDTASMMELDHEAGTSWCEYVEARDATRAGPAPAPHALYQRLAQPLAINYLDTDKISFERSLLTTLFYYIAIYHSICSSDVLSFPSVL